MATQNERAVIDLVINGQQGESSLKAITAATTNARKALYSMAETDPGYAKQKRELLELMKVQDARVVKINREKTAWQQFTTNMPSITAGVVGANLVTGAISAIGSAIPAAIAQYRAFDSASKELSAVTGATGRDLEYLNQQAARSGPIAGKSGAQMLEAYKMMASAKPELLAQKELLVETTKAAVTLSQAGNIGLAESTKVTAESLNQFGEAADQANRFINVIAAGAKEGSAEINEMGGALKASGTVAASQNVSFEATNAVLQSMSTIALKGEQAGTMFRNVLLTLGSGADETNPKVVGLEKALENLGKKNLSTAEITKLFGKENVVAAQHIITHREEIAKLTDKVTGTQEAFTQAAKNNASFDHQLEVFWARVSGLGVLIGTHLIPALTKVLEVGIGLAETLSGSLTPASEKATQAFDDQKAKVADLTKNLSPLLDRHDQLKKKSTLTKDEQAELAKIVAQVAGIVPSAVTEFDKYGHALDINTGKAREFIRMQQLLLKEKNKTAIDKTKDEQSVDQSALDKNVAKLRTGTTYERDPTSFGGGYRVRQMTEAERKALMEENAKLEAAIKDRALLLSGLSGDYMNEQPAAAPATPGKPAAPAGTGGGGNKPTDKEKKAAKRQVDQNHEAILAIEKMNLEAIRDDKTRELAKADWEANQEKEKVRKSTANAQYKAKWIAGIEDRLTTDKIKINQKYEEVERKAGLDHLKDVVELGEKELKVQREFALARISERVAAGGISKEQGKELEIQTEQQFLLAKELLYSQHYEAMMNAAWGNEEATKQVAQDLATALAGIDQAQFDKEGEMASARAERKKAEDEQDQQLLDKKKKRHQEEIAFRRELATQLYNVLSNDWTATLKGYKDYWTQATLLQKVAFVAQKAYALAEVAINVKRAIVAATAAAAGIPFPANLLAIAKVVALPVLSGIQAVAGINGATYEPPAFAQGGFTNSDENPAGYTTGPTYYRKGNYIAGEAGREFIMSAPMLANPVMANLAGALNVLQQSGGYRNLRLDEGSTTDGRSGGAAGSMNDQLLMRLISETQATRQALNSYASKKVENNYRLQEEYQNQVQQIRTDTKL